MNLILHPKLFRILRFLISGGSAALVNIGTLFALTEFFGLWYIISACLAFLASFAISFTLQKFWTFQETSLATAPRQALAYLGVAIINFCVNICFLYLLVEFGRLHYIVAELIVMVIIACISFFVYRNFIFKQGANTHHTESEFFLTFPHALVLLSVAMLAVLLPFAITTSQLGEPPQLPMGLLNETDYYYDRMQEIVDGHPFLGNPYFYEHRNDPPPAFFLADWLAAVPLLLGIPLMQVIYLNLFGWSLIFLLLAYAVVRAWNGSPYLALFGAILTYTESYSLMLRPVSMQVVFPFFLFFLLGYLLWLRVPGSRVQQILFGLSAALAASLYTYAWQIILVAFILTAIVHAIFKRDTLKALVLPTAIFVVILAPSIAMTIVQTHQPFYAETLIRIGLIRTHLPIFIGFVIPFVPLTVAATAFMTRPRTPMLEWLREPVVMFFGITATAITGVMLSNIITGLDLELPQHVERFVVVWFALATIYLLPRIYGAFHIGATKERVVIIILAALIFLGHAHYVKTNVLGIFFMPHDTEEMRDTQHFVAPLTWLQEHVPDSSVVWIDPGSEMVKYIAMTTRHYLMFHHSGVLQIMSDHELEDRYLTAHYFSLSKEKIISDHRKYGGVGNELHGYKTHNRKVRMCELLMLDHLGMKCGTLTDHVGYVGEDYFDSLWARYVSMRSQIEKKLQEYSVSYIVTDTKKGTPDFQPTEIPKTSKVYDDGRFQIYYLDLDAK